MLNYSIDISIEYFVFNALYIFNGLNSECLYSISMVNVGGQGIWIDTQRPADGFTNGHEFG